MDGSVEECLWTALATLTLWMTLGWWEWPPWMTLVQCCCMMKFKTATRAAGAQILTANQVSEIIMSIVLVPTLLRAMSYYKGAKDDDSEDSSSWKLYSTLTTMLPASDICFSAAAVGFSLLDKTLLTATAWYYCTVWGVVGLILHFGVSNSFTMGELRCVSMILAISMLQLTNVVGAWENAATTASSLYGLVAAYGFFGCCIICPLSCYMTKYWWIRVGINVVGPLLFVERMLMKRGYNPQGVTVYMPLSIQWLVQFLLEPESGYARFRGLIYWGITLVLCSLPTYALLRLPSNNLPVVVTRKWFHLVAILLFAPMIWKAPQLMSLSFAIAVCVLFVLEALRRDLPALQSFYVTFIDDNKDEETAIIVSHIFLIVGCAMPLWINEVLQSSGGKSSLLLAQFGVLCIGIGDAMGAVIGKCMGKHIWGRNNRTLEGSFAMLVSMIASGAFCCYSFRDFLALFFATSFVTLLEAFTFQLDNLVLPLAGSTVLLLLL